MLVFGFGSLPLVLGPYGIASSQKNVEKIRVQRLGGQYMSSYAWNCEWIHIYIYTHIHRHRHIYIYVYEYTVHIWHSHKMLQIPWSIRWSIWVQPSHPRVSLTHMAIPVFLIAPVQHTWDAILGLHVVHWIDAAKPQGTRPETIGWLHIHCELRCEH